MTAVIPRDTSLPAGCVPTETSLELPPGLPYETWQELLEALQGLREQKEQELDMVTWWLSDTIRYGERTYGETYAQAIAVTGLSKGRLQNIVWVGNKFDEISRRRDNLFFKHHAAVAALPPSIADPLLDEAEREGWSSRELYERRLDGEAERDGKDPAVARAERALERAREALEPLAYPTQFDLVRNLILDPLGMMTPANSVYPVWEIKKSLLGSKE